MRSVSKSRSSILDAGTAARCAFHPPFIIHHSSFIIIPFLAASHDDNVSKLWIIAFVIVIWAIQAIAKVAKGNSQAKRKPMARPPLAPLNPPPPRTIGKIPAALQTRPVAIAPRPAPQARQLPPLSNLHQPMLRVEQARPQVPPPLPAQRGFAEMLLSNKVITPAQAGQIRAELARRHGNIPPALIRMLNKAAAVKPPVAPVKSPPVPPSTPAVVAVRPAPRASVAAAIPSRSTVARWLDRRSLRSQFILAEALRPPLALRRKSHLP